MKRLLGKVSVYLDNTLRGQSSMLQPLGNGDFEILLTPQEDKYQMESLGLAYNADNDTKTALAHEFGHLVASLLRTPTSQMPRTLANEQEAWAIAENEYPQLDKQMENAALGLDAKVYGQ